MREDLDRPIAVQWCDNCFRQSKRAFDCTREAEHTDECDSYLAQEFRRRHQAGEETEGYKGGLLERPQV